MASITTTELTTKRARRASVILTDRMCEKRVTARIEIYDRKARGLYADIIPAGVASFYFKFTDPATGRQRSKRLGVYNPETFTVENARSEVYALKAQGPAVVVEQMRQTKAAKGRHGKMVAEIIEERIVWMKADELKEDGEMRPRIESWANVASHLRRLVKPKLGRRIASDVTCDDIATLQNDILDGKLGKPSVANARHMRRAVSGLYVWAAEAGRRYVPQTCRPYENLPALPDEYERERMLNEDEIRIFWHGLDRDDLPWDRRTRLALKFQLVTMLRGGELVAAHRNELFDLDGTEARFDVPAKRVKKRRVIQQPLSSLAVEIIKEALTSDAQQYVFESPMQKGRPLHRSALATALRGDKAKGLCVLLGLKPFTPHDLRRTAATLAGELSYSEAAIAKCLDHAVTKDKGEKVGRVTKRYVRSERMKQKRAVLDGIAVELRRIIGEQPAATTEMRMAA
jgi:integrase